jgi:CheY-like chemotaxis protein
LVARGDRLSPHQSQAAPRSKPEQKEALVPALPAHDYRRKIRVLLADADTGTRELYRAGLACAGYEVVDAENGRDALVKALTHRPHVVVTATRLPFFDGYQLCEVLRQDATMRTVPILVVTSEAQRAELDRARQAGATRVLTTPVLPDALLTQIQGVLTDPEPSGFEQHGDAIGARRGSAKNLHRRYETTTPPQPAPQLRCPLCDAALLYEGSYIGGVSSRSPEQWDTFRCARQCGPFEYRHRTRKLRRM